jgi:hypothetical protein
MGPVPTEDTLTIALPKSLADSSTNFTKGCLIGVLDDGTPSRNFNSKMQSENPCSIKCNKLDLVFLQMH